MPWVNSRFELFINLLINLQFSRVNIFFKVASELREMQSNKRQCKQIFLFSYYHHIRLCIKLSFNMQILSH